MDILGKSLATRKYKKTNLDLTLTHLGEKSTQEDQGFALHNQSLSPKPPKLKKCSLKPNISKNQSKVTFI